MKFLRKNKQQKQRFVVVGALSTTIDFVVLFLLHGLGVVSIGANFISTGMAFAFSFTANRNYTFDAKGGNLKKQMLLYFLFTFFGIWVLQPIIIALVSPALVFVDESWIRLLIAKLLATLVTLVWNYVSYSRVVFPKNPHVELH